MMQKEEVTRAKDKNRKVTDEECLRDGTKLSPVRSLLSNSDRSESKIQSTDYTSLKVPFPWRLWQLLEDSEKNGTQSIVSWLPDGDGFTIFKPVVFTSTIMKVYFTLTCYESFTHEVRGEEMPLFVCDYSNKTNIISLLAIFYRPNASSFA